MIKNHFERTLNRWQYVFEWRHSPDSWHSRDLDLAIVKFTSWPAMGYAMRRGENFQGFWINIRISWGNPFIMIEISPSLRHAIQRIPIIPRISIRFY